MAHHIARLTYGRSMFDAKRSHKLVPERLVLRGMLPPCMPIQPAATSTTCPVHMAGQRKMERPSCNSTRLNGFQWHTIIGRMLLGAIFPAR